MEERKKSHKRALAIVSIAILLAVTAGLGLWTLLTKSRQNNASLPSGVTSQINDFTVYYYSKKIPGNYTLAENSVSVQQGMLFATLRNDSGETIALTEQKLPPSLASQSRQNFEAVKGADGEAYITYQGSKMAGGLFSNEQNGVRTMVILVANDPIEKSSMEDLLRGLRPAK
jgi:hypothetical protein